MTGGGAWVAVVESGLFDPLICRFEDESAEIVPRPRAHQVSREPARSDDEQCPACGSEEWDRVRRLQRFGDDPEPEDQALAEIVCRRCGHGVDADGVYAVGTAEPMTDSERAEAMARMKLEFEQRFRADAEMLSSSPTTAYASLPAPCRLVGLSGSGGPGIASGDAGTAAEQMAELRAAPRLSGGTLSGVTVANDHGIEVESKHRPKLGRLPAKKAGRKARRHLALKIEESPFAEDEQFDPPLISLRSERMEREAREKAADAAIRTMEISIDGELAEWQCAMVDEGWVAAGFEGQTLIFISGSGAQPGGVSITSVEDPVSQLSPAKVPGE